MDTTSGVNCDDNPKSGDRSLSDAKSIKLDRNEAINYSHDQPTFKGSCHSSSDRSHHVNLVHSTQLLSSNSSKPSLKCKRALRFTSEYKEDSAVTILCECDYAKSCYFCMCQKYYQCVELNSLNQTFLETDSGPGTILERAVTRLLKLICVLTTATIASISFENIILTPGVLTFNILVTRNVITTKEMFDVISILQYAWIGSDPETSLHMVQITKDCYYIAWKYSDCPGAEEHNLLIEQHEATLTSSKSPLTLKAGNLFEYYKFCLCLSNGRKIDTRTTDWIYIIIFILKIHFDPEKTSAQRMICGKCKMKHHVVCKLHIH